MADITRLLSLQSEAARDPTSELARILAYAPPGGSTDAIGASLQGQSMNPMLNQGMPLLASGFGLQGQQQPQPQQGQVQGALPYGWGTGTGQGTY